MPCQPFLAEIFSPCEFILRYDVQDHPPKMDHCARIMTVISNTVDSRTALRDETRKLLLHRPYTLHLAAIAKAVTTPDHEVTEAWLKKFGQGKINNPGVITICALNEYLKNYKSV